MSEEEKRKTFSEELAEIVQQEGAIKADEPAESQPVETKEEAPAPSQEEPKAEKPEDPAPKKEVPFHKHPRWLRLQKELEEARQEAKQAREAAEARAKEVVTQPKEAQVPPQFAKIFGDDVASYQAWRDFQEEISGEKAREIYRQEQDKAKAEADRTKQAEMQAVQFAEEQFAELADETGIDFTDKGSTERNQILDICTKYGLFTPEGFPNIRAASELHTHLYPQNKDVVEEKKKVASRATSTSTAPAPTSDIMTPSKLREIERRGGMLSLLK